MSLSLTVVSAGHNAIAFYLPEPLRSNYPMILKLLADKALSLGAIDVVPAYNSLLVVFEPDLTDSKQLQKSILEELSIIEKATTDIEASQPLIIPVCYEGDCAPDLADVAQQHNMTTEAVIEKHIATKYTVCCLGFIPGFAFLGYVDDAIATPRRKTPRSLVVGGSVGIAGKQTGIYPVDSPGGWNIIGRTPKTLYAPEQGIISCFEMSNTVIFKRISYQTFKEYEADNKHE